MAVPVILTDISATASSNSPTGSEAVGTSLDDYLRGIQASLRGGLAHKGADIASATTTDVGAIAGLMNDITGTTTITGLGTVSAGIWKILKFEGVLTLTYNATSLILPGGASITTADGDVGVFISEGSGNWRCVSYFRATGLVVSTDGFTTGDVKLSIKTVADSGWVLMDDKTIGDASSSGTGRANADTSALFTLLWSNTVDADCAVSGGRGANAASDFAAHKTIALPKSLGRALACYGAGSGLTSRAMAKIAGTETVTLTAAESGLPSHQHTYVQGGAGLTANGFSGAGVNDPAALTGATGGSAASSGHANVQPTVFLNVMIKL